MFKRKFYHFIKDTLDILIKFGIGGVLGLLIANLFIIGENNSALKVLSISFLCITIVSYLTHQIIIICGRKREKYLYDRFSNYALTAIIEKNDKEIRTFREAKIYKIIAQADEPKFSILLSALNCDMKQCFIETQFAQSLLKEIAVGDSVAVVLDENKVMAILRLDGLLSHCSILKLLHTSDGKVIQVH